MPMAAIGK